MKRAHLFIFVILLTPDDICYGFLASKPNGYLDGHFGYTINQDDIPDPDHPQWLAHEPSSEQTRGPLKRHAAAFESPMAATSKMLQV